MISELKDSINTQVTKLVNSMCDDLRLLLFLKKQAGQIISIRFTHNSKQPFLTNSPSPERRLKLRRPGSSSSVRNFLTAIYFATRRSRKGIVAMLCADELCVEEFQISKRFDICRYSHLGHISLS